MSHLILKINSNVIKLTIVHIIESRMDGENSILELIASIRDVKRRSNFRTSNYMFEFGIVTFDIRFQFALGRHGK